MGKYDRLSEFLKASAQPTVPLTFAQIEIIVGFPLPQAGREPGLWSDAPDSETVGDAISQAGISAGFEAKDLDLGGEQIVFQRVAKPAEKPPRRHPLFGALKGMITVAPGTDLTAPADPDWGKVYD